MRNIRRRPTTSPRRPPATSVRPNVRAYPEITHCTDCSEASRPAWIDGIATLTIVTSSRVMNPTSRVTVSARHGWATAAADDAASLRRVPSTASVDSASADPLVRRRHLVDGVTHPVHAQGVRGPRDARRAAGDDDDDVALLDPADLQQLLVDLADHLVG